MKKLVCSLISVTICYTIHAQWATNGNNINTTNSGYVGINTTTPSAKLQINLTEPNSSIQQKGLLLSTNTFYTVPNETNSYYIKALDNGNGVTRFTVKGNGYVGLGTDAPTQVLDVRGNIAASGSINVEGDMFLSRTTHPYGYLLRPDVAGYRNMAFAASGATALDNIQFVSNHSVFTGNLHVGGSLNIDGGDLILRRTTHPTGYIVRPNTAGFKNIAFAVEGGGSLELFHVASDHSTFSGNVGIGTSNPGTYMLAVEGKIGARSVKVTLASWADHVFEKNYPLKSIDSLEAFIHQHKHLPNIPSAAEVKKEGVDLGEMQARLLEKIEELTLYVIELKKENDTIKEQLKKKKD